METIKPFVNHDMAKKTLIKNGHCLMNLNLKNRLVRCYEWMSGFYVWKWNVDNAKEGLEIKKNEASLNNT